MNISKGKIKSAQKVVIYGPEGIGKSTFASHFPEPVFIDTEGGTKKLDVSRFDRPTSWEMLLQQVEYVKRNNPGYKTLVIDTADWAEKLAAQSVCAKAKKTGIEEFGYGKGYTYLAEEFGKLLNKLEEIIELGINVVVTAHAKMIKVEQPEEMGAYDRWELKLTKQCSPLLKEWADMLLFANYKTIVENTGDKKYKARGGQQRIMYTTHSACWDAKNRDGLADVLPFEYSQIAHVVNGEGHTTNQKEEAVPQKPVTHETVETQPKKAEKTIQKPQETKDELDELIDDLRSNGVPVEMVETENETIPDYVPEALADLMKANDVTLDEIENIVVKRGYYPVGTPFKNYQRDFIDGCLIGAWSQVLELIKSERDLPF